MKFWTALALGVFLILLGWGFHRLMFALADHAMQAGGPIPMWERIGIGIAALLSSFRWILIPMVLASVAIVGMIWE